MAHSIVSNEEAGSRVEDNIHQPTLRWGVLAPSRVTEVERGPACKVGLTFKTTSKVVTDGGNPMLRLAPISLFVTLVRAQW